MILPLLALIYLLGFAFTLGAMILAYEEAIAARMTPLGAAIWTVLCSFGWPVLLAAIWLEGDDV